MLDQIREIIEKYNILGWGLGALAVLFAFTVCFRTFWGGRRDKNTSKIFRD